MKKPKFMESLRAILDDPANYDLIRWINIDKFIVLDPDNFSNTVIPKYFKHASFSSFIRQLHSYGFHKQTYANGSVEFTRDASMITGENGELTAERKKTPAQYQIEQLRQQVDDLKQQNVSLQEANEILQLQLNLTTTTTTAAQGGIKQEIVESTTYLPTSIMEQQQPPITTPTFTTSTSTSNGGYDDWWFAPQDTQQQQQQMMPMMMMSEPSPMNLPLLTRMPSLEEGKLRGQLSPPEDVDMTSNDMLMDNYFLQGF